MKSVSPAAPLVQLDEPSELLVCQWKGCSTAAHSALQLKNHIEHDHLGTNKASYRCDWQGCTFGERRKIYDLKTHVTLHHQHLSYFCKTCNKGFLRDQELRKHNNVGCPGKDAEEAISSRASSAGTLPPGGRVNKQVHSSPRADVISSAPSPVSSDSGLVVPRDEASDYSDYYFSDHSSPAEVPVFNESKKRLRGGENVERFLESVKREKIEPTPTRETLEFLVSANEMIEEDPDFLSNFDVNESFDFLQTLKKNIESMSPAQLNTLLDDVFYAPVAGEYHAEEGLDFSEEINKFQEESDDGSALQQIEMLGSLSDYSPSYLSDDFESESQDLPSPPAPAAAEALPSVFNIMAAAPAAVNTKSMAKKKASLPAASVSRPSISASSSSSSSSVPPKTSQSLVTVLGLTAKSPMQQSHIRTRSAAKKSEAQVVPQMPSRDSFAPQGSYRSNDAASLPTLASLNARNFPPSPSPALSVSSSSPAAALNAPYFGLSTSPASVQPSQISPADFSAEAARLKRNKDATIGLFGAPFLQSPFSQAYLVQPGSAVPSPQQVRYATTSTGSSAPSLYDRYAEKDSKAEKMERRAAPSQRSLNPLAGPASKRSPSPELLETSKVVGLMQTLDIKKEEREESNVPPKPNAIPTHSVQFKKPAEGLISPSSSTSVHTAMRFTKQDFIGIIDKVLKRV